MKNNPKTYKDIKETSKGALSYLKDREKMINHKEAELSQIESRVNDMHNAGMPTESEEKLLKTKEEELYNLEFDVNAIMTEQAYMDKLMSEVRGMLNVDVVTYGDSKVHIEKVNKDITKVTKEIEKKEIHIKKLDDTNPLKDRLRMDIIKKQDFLKELKDLELKINNRYSSFNSYESNRVNKLTDATTEKQRLENEIATSKTQMDEAYLSFASAHKEFVDEKLNANALQNEQSDLATIGETYDVVRGTTENHQTELQKAQENTSSKEKEEIGKYENYEHFLKDIERLEKQLDSQNNIISTLEQDKEWLYNRIEIKDGLIKEKDAKIEELEIKLDSWKSSYGELERLVNDLSKLVGYEESFLNANGDDIENPLGTLIERLERITAYVESEEYQAQVAANYQDETNQENAISPVLLGGLALGTIVLTTMLNK